MSKLSNQLGFKSAKITKRIINFMMQFCTIIDIQSLTVTEPTFYKIVTFE